MNLRELTMIGVLGFFACSTSSTKQEDKTSESQTEGALGEQRAPASLRDERFPARSTFKLMILNQYKPDFNPDVDVTLPSDTDFIAGPKVLDALKKSSSKALLPLLAMMNGFRLSTDETALHTLSKMGVSVALDTLKEVSRVLDDPNSKVFPIDHQVVLGPRQEEEPDLYYGENKISVNPKDWYTLEPSGKDFESRLSADLLAYQDKMAAHPVSDIYLLAARSRMTVKSSKSAVFNLEIALGARPKKLPFAQADDSYEFHQVVLPEIPNPLRPEFPANGPAIVLRFVYELKDKNSVAPSLVIEFGKLKGYQEGSFVFEKENTQWSIPRLEGNRKGSWKTLWSNRLLVNLGIEKIVFDLGSLTATSGETVVSAGFRYQGLINPTQSRHVMGAFRMADVSKQFIEGVNQSVNQQVQDAEPKVKELAQNKMKDEFANNAILSALFNQILK